MMSGMNMMDRAAALSKKRNLEGTSSPVTHKNSFDVLSDPELKIRARNMGAALVASFTSFTFGSPDIYEKSS